MARGLRAGRRIDEPPFPIGGWAPPSTSPCSPPPSSRSRQGGSGGSGGRAGGGMRAAGPRFRSVQVRDRRNVIAIRCFFSDPPIDTASGQVDAPIVGAGSRPRSSPARKGNLGIHPGIRSDPAVRPGDPGGRDLIRGLSAPTDPRPSGRCCRWRSDRDRQCRWGRKPALAGLPEWRIRRCSHPTERLVRRSYGFRVSLVLGRDMGYGT